MSVVPETAQNAFITLLMRQLIKMFRDADSDLIEMLARSYLQCKWPRCTGAVGGMAERDLSIPAVSASRPPLTAPLTTINTHFLNMYPF